jgi:hypothetical protein
MQLFPFAVRNANKSAARTTEVADTEHTVGGGDVCGVGDLYAVEKEDIVLASYSFNTEDNGEKERNCGYITYLEVPTRDRDIFEEHSLLVVQIVLRVVFAAAHTAEAVYLERLEVPVRLRRAQTFEDKDLFRTHFEHPIFVADIAGVETRAALDK